MTSSGVRPAFSLGERIQFSAAVDFSNGRWASTPFAAKTPANDSQNQQLTMNANNQYVGFRYVDFGADGSARMHLNYRTTASSARIRVTAGKPGDADTVVLAEVDLPATGGTPVWREISVPIPAEQRATGVKTVYVQMLAAGSVVFDWISFRSERADFSLDMDGKNISAYITNPESAAKPLTLIAAAYDASGVLTEVRTANITVPADAQGWRCDLPLSGDAAGKRIKAFLWDGNYLPYCEAATFE
jgi:hypothetical protein